MLKVKKDTQNNINDTLEEIVRCVTAPSFCVMPWKCVTMAVGDRTDPLVKKSVVHIYRTSVDGQNIFQIKVHNCKKEVCDHAICTKDCETSRQTNTQEAKEAMLNEAHKRKRKKRNKYPDENKESLSYCLANNAIDEFEKNSILKEHQGSKRRNPNSHKNKKNTNNLENNEKPSCTLQIFAEGRTRKLNFQLHPAMKVFLGKALDRIEGHDTKRPRTNSPLYKMTDPGDELLGKTTDGYKSKSMKKQSRNSQCYNKKRRTESVEEFEINLPDNTCLLKDNLDELYKNQLLSEVSNNISKRICHWESNQIPCDMENHRCFSEEKMNGYLCDNLVPRQQLFNGRGNTCKETDFPIGRAPDTFYNNQPKTGNTPRKTATEPIPESYHEREIEYNHNEGKLLADEEPCYSSNPHFNHHTFLKHQEHTYDSKYRTKGDVNHNPAGPPKNSGIGNNSLSYSNASQCFQYRTKGNIVRAPYIEGYHTDKYQHMVKDIRNTNIRNYSISDNRASMRSTDYRNSPPVYLSNTGVFSPPVTQESFPMSTEYGSFITNDGDYRNRFYGAQQYYDFSNHERACLSARVTPPQHSDLPYNQHDTKLPKKYIDRETQISQEERENEKDRCRFDHNRSFNTRGANAHTRSEKIKFISDTNKSDHNLNFEDEPTSDRTANYRMNNIINIDDRRNEVVHNDAHEKRSFHYRSNVSPGETEIASETKTDHQSKRNNCKESEKTCSNKDNRKSVSSTSAQNLPSCSNIIQSKAFSNDENIIKTSKADENTHQYSERKDKKNRNGKFYDDKAYLHGNAKAILTNSNPTTHSNHNLINEKRILCENKDEHIFEEQQNYRQFKHTKIASEEKLKNSLKINKRKFKIEDSNATQRNALHHGKTSREPHTTIRTQSAETSDSSNYLAEGFYINEEASEKSSDIFPYFYHFPEGYSKYQIFQHKRKRNGNESHSPEKINETNQELCNDEYNSKFFCYPSQISWDHFENLQDIIPNINRNCYIKVKETRHGKRFKPKRNILSEGESKLCQACSKVIKEDKTEDKSLDICHENKYESKDFFSENIEENKTQYKETMNIEESLHRRNENVHIKSLTPCDSTNPNLNLNLNGELKPSNCRLASTNINSNVVCLNSNVERNETKRYIIDSNRKESSSTVICENIRKRESKTLHSQSVKKFFNQAKEYLNFRKYSTSSIKSGVSNGVLQVGQLNSISQFSSVVDKIKESPILNNRNSVEALTNKSNSDDHNINKTQCYNPDTRTCTGNYKIDVPQSGSIQSDLCIKPNVTIINNTAITCTNPSTKMFKPEMHTSSQANLKDEKYRLYGSNETTVHPQSIEDSNPNFTKNEFKILESESECEGFSEEMYCYSSTDSQSEVAKNWVAKTNKKYIKYHNTAKFSRENSAVSTDSSVSNFKFRNEEKCDDNNKNAMINATIALSSDKKTEKNNKPEIKGQYQTNQCSKQKTDNKFSNIFSNSIKNNYKKIKGLVKKKPTRYKSKSPRRAPVLKSFSCTETQSQSCSSPVASTSTSTNSENAFMYNTVVEKFCNDSTANHYLSDSCNANSDPIITKIEPRSWQKLISKKFSSKKEGISETENTETENSFMSHNSIDESNLNRRSHHRFANTRDYVITPILSTDHSSLSGSSLQSRESDTHTLNHPVPSGTMHEYNQSDETVLGSSCFENPWVDPKTGFRPLFPT